MAEITVALVGGDRREIEVVRALLNCCNVRCFGLPQGDLPQDKGLCVAKGPAEALYGADVLILPMAGVNDQGRLFAPLYESTGEEIYLKSEDLAGLPQGAPVLVGRSSAYLRGLCNDWGLRLCEVAEHDMVAVPNAVPTAEGALALLLAETPITVSGMQVAVLGFGRVGEALAERLAALGAVVWVVNRGSRRRKKAEKLGFAVVDWEQWQDVLPKCNAVVNTVPTLLLGRSELARLPDGAFVLDLASGAGGVDFAAAAELGLRAEHALSLPGKVAPVSAGRILGAAYPRYLREICGLLIDDTGTDEAVYDTVYDKIGDKIGDGGEGYGNFGH